MLLCSTELIIGYLFKLKDVRFNIQRTIRNVIEITVFGIYSLVVNR